jgi:hypothetical protein
VNGDKQDVAADTVIVTGGGVPRNELTQALAAKGIRAHAIGDCDRVAGLEGANLSAAALALAI